MRARHRSANGGRVAVAQRPQRRRRLRGARRHAPGDVVRARGTLPDARRRRAAPPVARSPRADAFAVARAPRFRFRFGFHSPRAAHVGRDVARRALRERDHRAVPPPGATRAREPARSHRRRRARRRGGRGGSRKSRLRDVGTERGYERSRARDVAAKRRLRQPRRHALIIAAHGSIRSSKRRPVHREPRHRAHHPGFGFRIRTGFDAVSLRFERGQDGHGIVDVSLVRVSFLARVSRVRRRRSIDRDAFQTSFGDGYVRRSDAGRGVVVRGEDGVDDAVELRSKGISDAAAEREVVQGVGCVPARGGVGVGGAHAHVGLVERGDVHG